MLHIKTIFITVALLMLASCGKDSNEKTATDTSGKDSKEKIASDAIAGMEEMLAIVETVKDEASAKAAKPKLEALAKKQDGIEARLKALNISKEDFQKHMEADEALKKRVAATDGKMKKAMEGLNDEALDIIMDVMWN